MASGSDEESSEEEEESGSGSEEGSSDSEYEDAHKKKGVQGLIEIENPNRAVRKVAEKVTKIDLQAAGPSKSELSRREREELEKQRAQAHYQKLHAEGKTDQARADLARLAIIKQHRAEAAARREADKKGTFIFEMFISFFFIIELTMNYHDAIYDLQRKMIARRRAVPNLSLATIINNILIRCIQQLHLSHILFISFEQI